MIDFQTIFSDQQVISATTLSDRAVDLQSLADYGIGRELFVNCVTQGTHANDLRIQILGSDTRAFSSVDVIGDSGVITATELNATKKFCIHVNPTGKKYRYICLRYIPTIEGSASETISDGTAGSATVSAPPKVGDQITDVANSIRAYVGFVADFDVQYPYANQSMSYSG